MNKLNESIINRLEEITKLYHDINDLLEMENHTEIDRVLPLMDKRNHLITTLIDQLANEDKSEIISHLFCLQSREREALMHYRKAFNDTKQLLINLSNAEEYCQ